VTNLISLDPKALDAALAAIKPCVGARSAVAAIAGVRIRSAGGVVSLYVTDMESSVRKEIPTAVAHGEIDALVSHAELHGAAKLFKGKPITLTLADDELVVTNGPRTILIPGLRKEDFPADPESHGDHWLTLDAKTLLPVIERALRFASTDQTRPLLTGILIEQEGAGVRVTATDSYRLVTTAVTGGATGIQDQSAVVLARTLKMTMRALKKETGPILVRHHAERTTWEFPDAHEVWTTRAVEGQYPNYRQLLPDDGAFTSTVVVPRDQMIEAAVAANALARRNQPARLGINGRLELNLVGVDSPSLHEIIDDAQITHTTAVEGDATTDFEYGVNPEFFLDTLKAGADPNVTMRFISPTRPLLVTEPGTEFLVMPIRLNV
jgi:DNA polymerase-3 subunit beta